MIPYVGRTPRADPPAPEGVCAFCDARIVKVKSMIIPEYWDAVEPQPGVALSLECGGRPQPGIGSGSFDLHVPR
jgi:hypothetical protein